MKSVRFAIAQMNPTVGDFSGNTRKILDWIKRAEKQRADLVVFPEMALCGYPVWDLANHEDFVREGLKHLAKIVKATQKSSVTVVLGFIDHPSWREGKKRPRTASVEGRLQDRTFNALAWIEKGAIRQIQPKRLLPTYDVFLEQIFFTPGSESRLIPWRGFQVAPTICEDIWDQDYDRKPLAELAGRGADFAVNLSASPYYQGVSDVRDSLLKRQTVRHALPILYVNQVGAQDDLIFDGRSLFVNEEGRILFRAPAFQEGLFFFDWKPGDKNAPVLSPDPASGDSTEMYEALCLGVRDYCRKNGFKKIVIGLSGGIDSAVVAALAVDAVGADAVLGVTMPSGYSSRGSWEDSEELARRLGIEIRKHSIREKYEFLVKAYRGHAREEWRRKHGSKAHFPGAGKITLAMENLQARIRGLELMYLSNDEGRLLLTTGNKSELAMGYCTLYGDMAGGLAVLGDVYKTDVYRLARTRNGRGEVIPKPILTKAPSAELRPNQKDQDSLPPYEILDEILYLYIERNESREGIVKAMRSRGVAAKTVHDVIRKVDHNEYKRRQTPPILRVTHKAWFGRRMPITNRFQR